MEGDDGGVVGQLGLGWGRGGGRGDVSEGSLKLKARGNRRV